MLIMFHFKSHFKPCCNPGQVREAVGSSAAVLGFVGAPFTLATYIVEGGPSKTFAHTKHLAFGKPEVRLVAASTPCTMCVRLRYIL